MGADCVITLTLALSLRERGFLLCHRAALWIPAFAGMTVWVG